MGRCFLSGVDGSDSTIFTSVNSLSRNVKRPLGWISLSGPASSCGGGSTERNSIKWNGKSLTGPSVYVQGSGDRGCRGFLAIGGEILLQFQKLLQFCSGNCEKTFAW